jgi:hypothetical protein
MALVTLLRACEVLIMIAVAPIAALVVSALHCALLVGWNLTPFG